MLYLRFIFKAKLSDKKDIGYKPTDENKIIWQKETNEKQSKHFGRKQPCTVNQS